VPLLLAAVAYARVLGGEFVVDDAHTVVRSLAVKDLAGFLRGHFLQGFLHGARPVTDLTFALNYAAGGLEPWNYHLTNLTLHLAVVVLAWALVREVLRLASAPNAEWVAVAVAGVFAVHPLQSQAVSYVSQRSEVLASGLYLATLLLLLAAERRGLGRRGAPFLAGALATFLLALGAKPIAATLPAAWPLLVAVVPSPERRAALATWRSRAIVLVPFATLAALFAWRVLRGIEGGAEAGFRVPGLSPSEYLLTQLRAIAVYLKLLAWPAGQNVDWDFPKSGGLLEPAVLLAGLLLLALAGAAVALATLAHDREGGDAAATRVVAFGILWFFLVLSVTSSVIPLADLLVEHRVYLASLGPFLAAAALAERCLRRVRAPAPRVALATAAATLGLWSALAVTLHRRNAVWETALGLWTDAAAKSPGKARPHAGVGLALHWLGRNGEAILPFRRAALLAQGDPAKEASILADLGTVLIRASRIDEAVEVLGRVVALTPEDSLSRAGLATALRLAKDLAGAHTHAQLAVLLDPSQGDAWNVLAAVQLEEGDLAGARGSLERAMALDPDAGVHAYNLGLVLDRLGDRGGACVAWGRALGGRLEPALRGDAERHRELCR
jgi:tetratricopeptide (TPR) repeat protein